MKVKAVKKDEHGTIQEYKLTNGDVIDKEEAIQMVKNGELEGYNISTARDGSNSIRSNRSEDIKNLDELPSFK